MNSDPGIICFKHCHSSIFCQSVPQLCPVCHEELADSSVLPFRVPFPFVRAKQKPCAIVMKPSNGSFLNCYSTNTDLHIGVTTSNAVVVEYDVNGLSDSNADSWNECVIVYELESVSWYERWDAVLRDIADKRCFSAERYEENTFNCYSFVLAFVRRLQHEDLKKSSATKETFCEDLVIPRLAEACRYISLYRKVTTNHVFIQS